MRAGLYCRVSTDAQVEGYSIDAQKEMLQAYCISKEINEYEFYVDGGFSGSNLERPQIKRLMDDVKERKVDVVVVYKLDRISRSQKDTLYLIEEIFNPNGIGFVSIRENFDTTTPFGKAMIGILSVFAQLERETIYERTRMGMLERVKSGLWMGGGNRPLGYEYDRNTGTLVPKPKQAEMIQLCFKLYLEGMSPEDINDALGMSGERIVRKLLRSPVYIGKIPYKGKIYDGLHEPIISEEMFYEVQNMIGNRSNNGLKQSNYLLSGVIYCGYCGAKFRYQKWTPTSTKLYCYSQQKSRPRLIKDPNCPNCRAEAADVENAVKQELFKMSLDESYLDKKMAGTMQDISDIAESRIKEIDKQTLNLLNFISEGIAIVETKEKLKELEQEKKKLIKTINNNKKKEISINNFKEKIYNLHEIWEDLSFEEQRNIIITLIDKIIIKDHNISIHYNNVV